MTDKSSKNMPEVSAEEMFRIVLDTIPIRVFWKDMDSHFMGGNKAFLDDLGVDKLESIKGKSDQDFFDDPQVVSYFREQDLRVLNSGQPQIGIEEPLQVPGQTDKWLKTNKIPLADVEGQVIGLLATYEDITEQVKYRHLIEEQALIDTLTGIANRRKLQQSIDDFRGKYAGLLFIDLDYFKAVNDSLGHSIGDVLLQGVAQRLQALLPSPDSLLARLGGDEFSMFVPFDCVGQVQEGLELLARNIIKTFVEPFAVEHHIINVGASVGITYIDHSANNQETAFREADMAVYSAKLKGRNNYQFYDVSMREEAERKHKLGFYLRSAIDNNELNVLYQPQFDSDNQLIGAEALLRWHNNELGFVSPDEFISIAEEVGLIQKIGMWVLHTALDALLTWQPILDRNPDFKMAVNFSSRQFQNKRLAEDIEDALKARNIAANNLQVEITESVLLEYKDTAVRSMLKMQKIGISIAIDDFGTGYSSLSYLAMLPIDKLKIDRAFVTDLNKKSTNRKLVETLINMSKNLSIEVIAEGVETPEERNALLALGCHQFQGFLFSRPITTDALKDQYNVNPSK